jgi:hypothetical protein
MPASDANFRWVAKARTSVAFCLVGAVAGAGLYLGNEAYVRATATGSPLTSTEVIGEPADPAMASVEREIAGQNALVRADGHPSVSVALLEPFTASPTGDVSSARIVDALRGAYLAQRAMNAGGSLLGVQLILANEGTSDGSLASSAVAQLETLEGAPDHLVAVTGMGLDVANTEAAASLLEGNGIAMFGADTVADQFTTTNFPGFVQVTPNVADQVELLAREAHIPGRPVLVYDEQAGDLYTGDLKADFARYFRPSQSYGFTPDEPDISLQFQIIASEVCPRAGQAPVILYAGRADVLQALIQEAEQTADCAGKDIRIVTASDADGLSPAVTRSSPGAAQVCVEYTDIEPTNVTNAFAGQYRAAFATTADVTDPWTTATYDAMMAAWTVISHAYSAARPPSIPNTTRVLETMPLLIDSPLIPGATGHLEISADGQLVSPDIPIFLDYAGKRTLIRRLPL